MCQICFNCRVFVFVLIRLSDSMEQDTYLVQKHLQLPGNYCVQYMKAVIFFSGGGFRQGEPEGGRGGGGVVLGMGLLIHDLGTISRVSVRHHASAPLLQETEPLRLLNQRQSGRFENEIKLLVFWYQTRKCVTSRK
jgi:hypothetical protein